ncbi:hypothetical protein D3871_00455 [Noviherbaspirillum saxi]|uniref:Uncharacterized protein n=1 Tax=Noviherbaspirillum saxi TaxID=2320863 RepID=A0A3A3FLX0_9BURK|nr:hypothetical protein D3871_00455 [Noviherbaspirillum saxi]
MCAGSAVKSGLATGSATLTSGTPISDDYRIDALIEDLNYRWNTGQAIGTPVTVSYSFVSGKPPYGGTDNGTDYGFLPFSEVQKCGARH